MNLRIENSRKSSQAMAAIAVWREKVQMHVSKNLPSYRSLGLRRVDSSYTHECDAVLVKHAQTEVELLDNVMLKTTGGY